MNAQLSGIQAATEPRAVARSFIGGPRRLLIGGEWVDAQSGETFETIDPTTEEVLTTVAAADRADVDLAVAAARRALDDPSWSDMDPHERTKVLLAIADVVEEHVEELAALDSFDYGGPLWMTRLMALETVKTFRYFAGWPTKLYGQTLPSDSGLFRYTLREPVGVCGLITPWNAPLLLEAWKIAPALACGNTVILKPAEQSPLSALRFGELVLELDLPPGVVNILTGYGETAGAALVAHAGVDKISFTGSTSVGKEILRASAGNLKRVTLELGGKSPHIIFADADLGRAAATAAAGFVMNSGQVCAAGSRVFVQEDIREEFVGRLVEQVDAMAMGDPFHPETMLGPLVSRDQYERVGTYLDLGRSEGAVVRLGGNQLDGRGFFVQPTVFDDVANHMRIAREEIFGPVGSVIPFTDETDAVFQGNDTVYGLAAGVWTSDLSKAHRMARAIKAGHVTVNKFGGADLMEPFGGYKQSGIGRENGTAVLDAYTETKTVVIQLS